MHTAIYARVSTEEQASEGFSIHAQKDKLTKYAESNDWIITDYYVDDGCLVIKLPRLKIWDAIRITF